MRNEKIKVVIWGFGAMGSGMAQMILNKKGFDIIGVCDKNPNYVGKSIINILNITNKECKAKVYENIEDIVKEGSCDVVLLATDSYTKKAFPKIKWLLEHKVNVISTAEEMAYPKANNPLLAKEMDELAKTSGVSVLGTGVNPGMMMDLLVICLTGIMEDIKEIEVSRINSLSPFGKTVMEEQGVGLSIEDFNIKENRKEIAGHVGFKESINMISDALKWNITKFDQTMSPIISKVQRKSSYGFVEKGNVAGVNMQGFGYTNDEIKIKMNHPQQIEPQLEGVNTGDYIKIVGKPNVNMAITPEIDGGIGTIAICVNMIPHILNASPGLKTMIDLPVPRAILGDVREMIN